MRKNRIFEESPDENPESFKRWAESLPIGVVCVNNLSIEWHNQSFANLFDPQSAEYLGGKSLYVLAGSLHDEKALDEIVLANLEAAGTDSALLKCLRVNGEFFLGQFRLWNTNVYSGRYKRVFLVQELDEWQLKELFQSQTDDSKNDFGEDHVDGSLLIAGSRIVYANARLHEMLGYPKGTLAGMAHWKIYHFDFRNDLRERVKARLCSKVNESSFELILQKSDGSALPVIGRDKKVIVDGQSGLRIDFTDVSQNKKIESQKFPAQNIEHFNSMIGSVANDFNNILMIITGCAQLMFHSSDANEMQLRSLQKILQASRRARKLIEQLLPNAIPNQSKGDLTQLSSIVDEMIDFMRSALPSHINIFQKIETNLDVYVFFDDGVRKEMAADLTMFSQDVSKLDLPVLLTLQDDSVFKSGASLPSEVGPDGNAIMLEMTVLDHNHEKLRSNELAGQSRKSIPSEANQGMPREGNIQNSRAMLQDIPSDYERPNPVFRMKFSVANRHSNQIDEHKKILLRGVERILLVDDEVSVVDTITQMLEPFGYHVTSAYGSLEALSVFRNTPYAFDMVLTDMTMPKMTGLFLASELIKIRPDIPIIILTGFVADISIGEAKSMGIHTVLTKPFSQFQLLSAIRNRLDSIHADVTLTRDKN
jgi:PAS domain S-box-containing protein